MTLTLDTGASVVGLDFNSPVFLRLNDCNETKNGSVISKHTPYTKTVALITEVISNQQVIPSAAEITLILSTCNPMSCVMSVKRNYILTKSTFKVLSC